MLRERLARRLERARLQLVELRVVGHLAQALVQVREHFARPALLQQLDWAVRLKGNDYYEQSSAEARLRELRVQLENERAAEKALKIS